MKKLFYLFCLPILIFTSCSSEDSTTNSESTSAPYLVTDTATDNILPTKIVVEDSDGDSETIVYTYNGKKITKIQSTSPDSNDNYYLDLIYTDTKLTEQNFYKLPGEDILETYTYNSEGKINSFTTKVIAANEYTQEVTYNADNSEITIRTPGDPIEEASVIKVNNGNLIEQLESNRFFYTYTYDDKNAPFKNLENRAILLPIYSENNDNYLYTYNNILTETIYNGPNADSPISSAYTYEYTYTDFGFPRVVTEKDGNEDITTYTYTYNND